MIDPSTVPVVLDDVPPTLHPLAVQTCDLLASRYGEWCDADDQAMSESVFAAVEQVVPRGAYLWHLMAADRALGRLDSPGAMADTIEEVVRDTLRDTLAPAVVRWADAVYGAEHHDVVPTPNRCEHLSATGVDDQESSPVKLWRCDSCGQLYRCVPVGDGLHRDVPAESA